MRKPTTLFVWFLILSGGCSMRQPLDWCRVTTRCSYKPHQSSTINHLRDSNANNIESATGQWGRSVDSIVNRVAGAVVRVRSELSGGATIRLGEGHLHATTAAQTVCRRLGGSGVIIASNGIILTNEHVVRNAEHVTVTLADGSVHEVTRILPAPKLDLAVLYIDVPTATFLSPSQWIPDPGTTVVALSAARRDKPRGVRTGIITNRTVSLQDELDPSRTRWYDDLLESTAKLEPGYSGGPLLDMNGRLIGINTAALGGPEDDYARAYAIPLHRHNREIIANLSGIVVPFH